MTRLIVLSDVHGNPIALEAVRKAIRQGEAGPRRGRRRPRAQRPRSRRGRRPAARDGGRRRGDRQRQHRHRGRRLRLRARRFPWMTDGVPDTFRAAAEWAHDALGDERVAWLRRLPSERRLRADDGTMVLVCHASPGSQTAGFDQALDPNVIIERAARTDARVIACGHTHLPEVRDLGWKLIVNDGSAGYVFDGEPTASWARIDIDDGEVDGRDPAHRVRRPRGRQRDLGARPARRRLPRGHGPHREPRPMTGADAAGRRDRDGPGHRARQRRRRRRGRASSPAAPGSGTIESFDPSRLTARIAGEVRDFDAERDPRPQGAAPDRPLHPVRRWSRHARRSTRPACPSGSRASSPSGPGSSSGPGSAASGRSSTASPPTPCAAPTGSARSSSRWASRTSAPARSPSSSG